MTQKQLQEVLDDVYWQKPRNLQSYEIIVDETPKRKPKLTVDAEFVPISVEVQSLVCT